MQQHKIDLIGLLDYLVKCKNLKFAFSFVFFFFLLAFNLKKTIMNVVICSLDKLSNLSKVSNLVPQVKIEFLPYFSALFFWTSYDHSIYVLCLRGLRLFHGVLSFLRKLFLNNISLIFLCFLKQFQESSAEVVIHTCKKIHIQK